MKLYKVLSTSMVALTLVGITALAASAGIGGRKPFVVPAFCSERTASFDHGRLLLGVDGFADDDAGFNVRTPFANGGSFSDFSSATFSPFNADSLSFTVSNLNGNPITGRCEAESFLFPTMTTSIFRKAKPDSNGRINLVYNNNNTHVTALLISVVVNRVTGNPETVVVTNFVLNGNQNVPGDLVDTDPTFACFD